MNEIKVICCDVDGTLLRDDKLLSEENKLWISRAVRERGIKFVIVSGRMFSALKNYNKILGITGLSSCLNGTLLVDENDNILVSHTISREVASMIVEVHENSKVDMIAIAEDNWYSESKDNFIYQKKLPMYLKDCIVQNPRELIKTTSINKFVFMSENRAELESVKIELVKKLGNPDLVTFYAGENFFEVMTGGITKGTAVDDLINYYKIDRSQIMSLGDDVNDVDMFRKSGLGVAMGNALDCAKEAADAITDTNQNDGVAKAIQKFVFLSKESDL